MSELIERYQALGWEEPTGKFVQPINLSSENLVALSERFDLMLQEKGDRRCLYLDDKGGRFGQR